MYSKDKKPNYVEFSKEVHFLNAKWWTDLDTGKPKVCNLGERVMLVVSELGEAMEGVRKGLMDDHLPHRPMIEVELADTVIRLFDIMGAETEQTMPHLRKYPQDSVNLAKYEDGSSVDVQSFTSLLGDNISEGLLNIVKHVVGIYEHKFWIDCALTITLCDLFAQKYDYDLWGAVAEKLDYNKDRRDHQRYARLEDGGKQF